MSFSSGPRESDVAFLCVQKVTQQLAAGTMLPVRVTGPIGRTADRTLDHPVLLIFAGGVGVSFCTFVFLCLFFSNLLRGAT